ncbi:unnamed protein product [marine sediment metagenome]|uniref:STAS domain-containing protein n=1 Tax=marine sediment metagenome TaxID=412755 RepID=X0UE30_9ZZZZ
MEIKIGMQDNVVVLSLAGDLVASSAENLINKVRELVRKKFTRIIIDMSKVNFMDSSGLGACMASYKALSAQNGILVITGPKETAKKIFRLTKADKKLNITPSKPEALKIIHQ